MDDCFLRVLALIAGCKESVNCPFHVPRRLLAMIVLKIEQVENK